MSDSQVLHAGEDCWTGCNQVQGPCAWCGTGYCCRLAWSDTSNGCDGSIGGSGHTCVDPSRHWGRLTDTYCDSTSSAYPSQAAARAACAASDSCTATYDSGCDGTDWKTCTDVVTNLPSSTSGSCVDTKEFGGGTQLARNDDAGGTTASFLEWTCPSTGTYFVVVEGYGSSTGTYTLTVDISGGQPCSGGGLTLDGTSGTISFMDTYNHNTVCDWHVSCPANQVVSMSFVQMQTEHNFDYVSIYEGLDNQANRLLHVSGSLSSLSTTTVTTASNVATLEFTSDGSVSGPGFEVDYNCGAGDPCTGIVCGAHGSCAVGQCNCDAGYSDATCSTHDPCINVHCNNHGSCDPSSGNCLCDPGYSGDNCGVYDICFPVDCGHGYCHTVGGACHNGLHFEAYILDSKPGGFTNLMDIAASAGNDVWAAGWTPTVQHEEHTSEIWYPDDNAFVSEIDQFDMLDNYVLRWRGHITVSVAGNYGFKTMSDDGSLLMINGQVVVNNDGDHSPVEQTGTVNLVTGTHDIVVLFYEQGGGAQMMVSWQEPGGGWTHLGGNVLSNHVGCDGAGYGPGESPPAADFECVCDANYSGRDCQVLDPCYRDQTECEEPHPAAVCALPADPMLLATDRGCATAQLRTPPWWHPTTPAEEYPSIRQVCDAGIQTAVERTSVWLDRAEDYRMQAAEGNAGVIAQQLCLERRFESLSCLSGASPAEMSEFVAVHDQACEIAHSIKQGHSVDSMLLETTDVRELTFQRYSENFDAVSHYVQTLLDSERSLQSAADLRTQLATEQANAAANAHDEQGLWQAKVSDDASRMAIYRQQVADLQEQIDQRMDAIGIAGPALLQSVSSQIDDSTQAFRRALGVATMRRQERESLQQSIQQMQGQLGSLQTQMNGLRADQDQMRSSLQRQIASIQQRQNMAQHQIDIADPSQDSAQCNGNCVQQQPFSNGCGNDFMGSFHSWAMMVLEDTTGCPSVPWVANDFQPCCDTHDICYSTCGMTQEFCDQQLTQCMQATATLPECSTSIGISGFIVNTFGCDHFIEAQQQFVMPACLPGSEDELRQDACVTSDVDQHFDDAENICDTVAGYAGTVAAWHVPVVSEVASEISMGATAVSYGLSTVQGWFDSAVSYLGRRLQDGCGDMDPAACQQMHQATETLRNKLSAAKGMLDTATALGELNTKLLGPDAIDTAALARIDMTFLDLNLLEDDVLVNSFQAAAGTGATVESDVRQLVTLIRTKLEQTRSYYQAALSKQDNEQRRDLLGRRAQRATDLVQAEADQTRQLTHGMDYFDAKIKVYSHLQLQYLLLEVRAFEYEFLTKYNDLNLDTLRNTEMTAQQYHLWIETAEINLRQAHTAQLQRSSNCGTSATSHAVFQMTAAASSTLARTHKATFTIAVPDRSRWYGTSFSSVSVFLAGLPGPGSVTIQATQTGTSVFMDEHGQERRYTHHNLGYPVSYDPTSCTSTSRSIDRLQACGAGSGGTYIH